MLNSLTCSLLFHKGILDTGGNNNYSRSHCTGSLTIPSDHPKRTKKNQLKAPFNNFKVLNFATYVTFSLIMYQTHLTIWVH